MDVLAHKKDKETLKSMAVTRHDIRFICQPRIFETIELDPRCSDTFQAFFDLLESNPPLALYVKNLKLTIAGARSFEDSWLVSRLSSMLDRLSNIESFTLYLLPLMGSELSGFPAYYFRLQALVNEFWQ